MSDWRRRVIDLYGVERGADVNRRIAARLARTRSSFAATPARGALSARDAILITYGDQLRDGDTPPLRVLADFCNAQLRGVVSGIHLLPFYPYSSDDGFSVIDYTAVDPALGTWADVAEVGRHFRLMFDGVINHVSAHSAWFQAFLRDEAPYRDYFITVEDEPDLSQVVRPRALPLLTEFDTAAGRKKVWTTFSADQIDLDYHNPAVLVDIIDVLLTYAERGAAFIRLDAIAYLWKEIGTGCIHLPQTHRVIQLLRAVLDEAAPHVLLITETNVPHADNLSYFGDGRNEAQLVYNFALPPLTLHALTTGDASALTQWAADLSLPSHEVTFFNFLASHDGIGLNPARGLLRDAEIDALVDRALAHGGRVSYKHAADGSTRPYELNINYFDALSDPTSDEPLDRQVDRFVAAHAIMLALVGVPGLYFHSLFGSRGWPEGVTQRGHNRAINRQKLDRAGVERELQDDRSLRRRVFQRLKALLQARSASPAFDPHGVQRVLTLSDRVFAVERAANGARVRCVTNVSRDRQTVRLETESLTLLPYQTHWIEL